MRLHLFSKQESKRGMTLQRHFMFQWKIIAHPYESLDSSPVHYL